MATVENQCMLRLRAANGMDEKDLAKKNKKKKAKKPVKPTVFKACATLEESEGEAEEAPGAESEHEFEEEVAEEEDADENEEARGGDKAS